MRRTIVLMTLALVFAGQPALAKVVGLTASPNPASVGDRVRHTVEVGTGGWLDVWVSASGFQLPGAGTMPAGSWTYRCCPSQTAGTPAWHFRSSGPVPPGSYRFGAVVRMTGSFLSTAVVGGASASVWIRIR